MLVSLSLLCLGDEYNSIPITLLRTTLHPFFLQVSCPHALLHEKGSKDAANRIICFFMPKDDPNLQFSQQHRQYALNTSKVRSPPKLKSSTKTSPNTRIFCFHPQPTTTNKQHSLVQQKSTSNHSDSPFSVRLLLSIDILVVIDRSEQFLVHLLFRIHRTLQQLQLMNEMPAMFAARLGILHKVQ